MPLIYCPTCGAKQSFASVKPKSCSSCHEPFEVKPVVRQEKAKRVRYVEVVDDEPEIEQIEAEQEFNLDPRAWKFEKFEGGLMTVKDLRESGASFERGGRDDGPDGRMAAIREEALSGMLNPGARSKPSEMPPPIEKPRSTARRAPSKLRPVQE